jgi:hypothetical protein
MLMDDNIFDDGYEPRTVIRNHDAAMDEAREAERRTTPDAHEAAREQAEKTFFQNELAAKVFNPDAGLLTVEDEAQQQEIREAAAKQHAQATAQAEKQAAEQSPAGTPGQPHDPTADTTANKTSGAQSSQSNTEQATTKAEKPNELENALAKVRLNNERQQRLIILGDPDIERRFLSKLAERGDLHYSGGSAVINISRKKALKLLEEVANSQPDTKAVHALSMEMKREGGGIARRVKAGVANILHRYNEVDVVVVGKPDVRQEKLKELGSFVEHLESRNYVEKGAATIKDGGLVVPKDETVNLKPTSKLYDIVSDMQDKVQAHQRDKNAEAQDIREFKDKKTLKELNEAKAKDAPESSAAKPGEVNKHARELAERLDLGFQDPDLLRGKSKGQVESESILTQLHALRDPTVRELQTLPDAERQRAIVQLAALVAKVDDKQYDQKGAKADDQPSAKLDNRAHADSTTIREKMDAFVVMEAKRDPNFAANAEPMLAQMVERNILTEKQAEAITARVAEVTAAAKDEQRKEEAAAEAAGAKPAATADATAATAKSATEVSTQASGSETVQEATTAKNAAPEAPAAESASKAESKTTESTTVAAVDAPARDKAEATTATQADTAAEQKTAATSQTDDKAASADNASALGAHSSAGTHTEPAQHTAAVEQKSADVSQTDTKASSVDNASALAAGSPAGTHTESAQHTAPAEQKSADASPADTKASSVDNAATSGTHSSSGDRAQSSSQAGVSQSASEEPKAASSVKSESAASSTASGAESTARETPAEVKSMAPEQPQTLRERIATLAREGSHKMTAEQAHSLVAELDGIRSKPLSALDAGSRNKPSQTLANVETLLKRMESGKLGPDLQAQAKDLAEPFQKWVQQDDARREAAGLNARTDAVSPATQAAPEVVPARAQEATSQREPQAAPQAEAPSRVATPEAAPTPAQPSAEQLAREQAAVRLTQTEAAISRLSTVFGNAPGALTHPDKSWNEAAVQRAAQDVLRLDPESVAKMDASIQGKAAGYAMWVADKAQAGKLPGFASAEGKAQAAELGERGATLWKQAEGNVPSAVSAQLTKADRMVKSRATLDAQTSLSSSALSSSSTHRLSSDLVSQVFSQNEIRQSNLKNLLKTAPNLTPESIKVLDPQTQARTAVAVEHIAKSAREGALGAPFAHLPSSVQKQIQAAEKTGSKLLDSLGAEPAMIDQAKRELHGMASGSTQNVNAPDAKAASKSGATEASTSRSDGMQDTGKSGGRGHDR